MGDPRVHWELRGEVAVVRMDDGKANALSPLMIERLCGAFDRARREAKAVALLGRPGRFSAGFDLKVMMSGPEAARALVMAGGELLMHLYEHPQPLVVGCTGHAIAAGVLLVATGDLRLGAAGDFKLGLNEVHNAMPVPILAHELARDRLDPRELSAAVLTSKMYDPQAALRAGWLDRVVAPDQVEDATVAQAARLAALPAAAYARTKRSLRRRTIAHVRDTLKSNIEEFSVGQAP